MRAKLKNIVSFLKLQHKIQKLLSNENTMMNQQKLTVLRQSQIIFSALCYHISGKKSLSPGRGS